MSHPIQERINAMFSDLSFDKRRHLYYIGSERVPSVTGIVSTFGPKFNAEAILPHSARKQNVSTEFLRQSWDTIRDIACYEGTQTHKFAEDFDGRQKPVTELQKAAVKFFLEGCKDKYNIVGREIMVYSGKYRYAGTFDVLLQEKYTGRLILGDYKTNKDLFKSYDYLYPPFDALNDNPWNKYQLQLGLYKICLEDIGVYVDETYVIYLDREGNYEMLDTSDYTPELRTLMDSKLTKHALSYSW